LKAYAEYFCDFVKISGIQFTGSKFIWEEVITELSTPQVDMSGQHLTRCYNAHLLYAVTELNLSNNDLINADGLNHLQKLVTLILSNNKIVCCRGLINMPCLKHL